MDYLFSEGSEYFPPTAGKHTHTLSSQSWIKRSSLYCYSFIVTVGSPLRLLLYLYKEEMRRPEETLQYFFMRSRHSCALHGVDNVLCKSEGLLTVEWCNAPQIILFRPDEYHNLNPSRASICFIGQWALAVGTVERSDNIYSIKSEEQYFRGNTEEEKKAPLQDDFSSWSLIAFDVSESFTLMCGAVEGSSKGPGTSPCWALEGPLCSLYCVPLGPSPPVWDISCPPENCQRFLPVLCN